MVCPTCMLLKATLQSLGVPSGAASEIGRAVGKPVERKVKRKASAYSKRYGKAFRRLKKKHPRMKFSTLAKKAHRAAKK